MHNEVHFTWMPNKNVPQRALIVVSFHAIPTVLAVILLGKCKIKIKNLLTSRLQTIFTAHKT